jgi:hypothetical protein
MIALNIDDILAAYNDTSWMHAFKATLGARRFKIEDLADLSQLLGMHTTRDKSNCNFSMDQSKHVKDILIKYHMADCKPSSLPMEPGFLSGLANVDSSLLTGVAKDVYSCQLGILENAAVCTRPDVCIAFSILGSAQASPTEVIHLQALNKVVRYLKGTIEMRLTSGGVSTTSSYSHASRMQSGRMTIANVCLDPDMCSH